MIVDQSRARQRGRDLAARQRHIGQTGDTRPTELKVDPGARRTEDAGHAGSHRSAGRGHTVDRDDDLSGTDPGKSSRRAREDLGHGQTTGPGDDGRADPRIGATQLVAERPGLLRREVDGVGVVQGSQQAGDARAAELGHVDRPIVVALQIAQDLSVEVGLTAGAGARAATVPHGGKAEAGGEGENDRQDGEQSSRSVHVLVVPVRRRLEPTLAAPGTRAPSRRHLAPNAFTPVRFGGITGDGRFCRLRPSYA